MFLSILMGFGALASCGLVGAATAGTHKPRVRAPPTLTPSPRYWQQPPPTWMFGNWWVSHASNPEYAKLYNFQWDHGNAPPGSPYIDTVLGLNYKSKYPPRKDLSTYNLPYNASAPKEVNELILSAFGYDFFPTGDTGVWDFKGTGHFQQVGNSAEVMAWGVDCRGEEYLLVYETPLPRSNISAGAPAGLDVLGRKKGGPSHATLQALVDGVKGLGMADLTALAEKTVVLPTDDRRDGQKPYSCGDACWNNDLWA